MKSILDSGCKALLDASPKKIVLSGPSGFLGARVLDSILDIHAFRTTNKRNPGEVILLSSSPGNLMRRLVDKYGASRMKTIRASRVDYYTQHDVNMWMDQLGSLGVEGNSSVFVNLAAVAGPVAGKPDAMMDVNYKAPLAAADACQQLGFGHWIQSSTQATNAERSGQVPYSKAKAMIDFALSRMTTLPVSVACIGLLYNRKDGMVGQDGGDKLNMIDLALLPLTPIMGDGSAPLQPLEVHDAAERIAYLACADASSRPIQIHRGKTRHTTINPKLPVNSDFRVYDAVGPETMSMLEMLRKFAHFQGNTHFYPVHIDYRNMERVLNVKSLGNLNRQFVSLLRSEQESSNPIIGNPETWEKILGPDAKLMTLNDAFCYSNINKSSINVRAFPYLTTLKYIYKNPGVIRPGIALSWEIVHALLWPPDRIKRCSEVNK